MENSSSINHSRVFREKLTTQKINKILVNGNCGCDLFGQLCPWTENIYEIALNDFVSLSKTKASGTTKFDVSIIGLGTSDGTVYCKRFFKQQLKGII